jgi:hypothetical protein
MGPRAVLEMMVKKINASDYGGNRNPLASDNLLSCDGSQANENLNLQLYYGLKSY